MAGQPTGQDGIGRRKYLGLAAAVTFAGCTETASSRGMLEATPSNGTATNSSAEEAATAEPDATDEHIAAAQGLIESAYTAFLSEGDAETLADVTAASYPFEGDDVFEAIDDANRALNQAAASGPDSEQAQTIADLESLSIFIETVGREQEQLTTAHWWVKDIPDLFFEEAHSTLDDNLDAVTNFGSETEQALDELEAEIDTNAARSIEAFDSDAVSGKLDQMRAEIDTLDAMEAAFAPATDGLVHLWDAVREYKHEDYADAMTEYGDAGDDFGDAIGKFEDLEPAPAFESNVEGMAGATAALEAGCDKLAVASAGKADGADTTAELQTSLAHEEFDSNDDVAEMPSIVDGPGGD